MMGKKSICDYCDNKSPGCYSRCYDKNINDFGLFMPKAEYERESCEECDYEEEKSYWTKTQFEDNVPDAWFSLADYCTDCVTEYDGIYCCDLPQEMWKDKIMQWKKEMRDADEH